ncbi:glycosyltransferase family 2 protein [Actinospica sp. MGRD01-02]|uniref:Glycosyltransferase family 2 protein n=1 Tax=Actinospica acidithermotolerans TaxID=2828514 RepID=A0A941EJW2_9ACTN|nr:glycosyltransferase family 2 protein [Actinospica acidithermotolerans]MBR7830439.1 glycosyltransferase family 2 protein [Actinospica acidithermotolerans]
MYDGRNLVLLSATMAALIVVIWQPLNRRFDDSDKGTDRLVELPPFRKPSNARLAVFFIVGLGVSTVIIGMRHPQPLQVYQGLVASLVRAADRQPSTATIYAQHLTPLVPAAVVGYLVTMSLVLPATIGRRLMILAHAPLFIAVSALSDTFVGLAEVAFRIPPEVAPVLTIYLEYLLGFMMVFRLVFTTYALPRVTRQPIGRRGDWRDSVEMLLVLAASTGIVFPFALWLIARVGDHPVLEFVILVSLRTAISDFVYVLLGLCRWAGGGRPRPGDRHPPLDIIIPAYNEEFGIERLLRSIDRAAGRYGGPVHVVLCDDGSTDATGELAEATMRAYAHATGEVILGTHGGKAKALNQALGRCTAEFVFRLDADCAVDQDCFRYAIPHFLSDPRIGLVGALTVPKEPYYTWIDRMRCMEQIFNFGFSQVMLAEVDAVPCILGSFMGFRRQAALDLGGFVSGMFGEDAEFTCALGRRGARAALDPRIVSYEDVPPNLRDLRVQRFRWSMAGMMNFGRFTPWGNGAPGPRFWYQLPKSAGMRFFSPAHFFMMVLALQYAAIAPGVAHNVVRLAWLIFVSFLPGTVPRVLMLLYYRRLGVLLWVPMWLVFSMLKRVYLLEAALGCGVRPVRPPLALRGPVPRSAGGRSPARTALTER